MSGTTFEIFSKLTSLNNTPNYDSNDENQIPVDEDGNEKSLQITIRSYNNVIELNRILKLFESTQQLLDKSLLFDNDGESIGYHLSILPTLNIVIYYGSTLSIIGQNYTAIDILRIIELTKGRFIMNIADDY